MKAGGSMTNCCTGFNETCVGEKIMPARNKTGSVFPGIKSR